MTLRSLAFVLVLGGAGFGAWLFWPKLTASGFSSQGPIESTQAPPAQVEAVVVRRGDLPLTAEATGYLEAWRRVEVCPEVSGRVVELLVREGTRAEAGSLLFRLDDRQTRLELEEAEADWLKLKARYAVDYLADEKAVPDGDSATPRERPIGDRQSPRKLFEQGLISREELEMASRRQDAAELLSGGQRQQIQAASIGLLQAERRVERLRLFLERSRVVAPFSGRVADLAVEVGQQVTSGQACLKLLDDSGMKVEVEVLEGDLVHVRHGAPAWVRVPSLPDLRIEGRVFTINPQVDPETGTGRVTVEIPNPGSRLMPGLFSYVDLETRRLPGVLLVPSEAVLERQGSELVFRIVDGRALWTYVETGAESRGLVEIADGLAAGDVIAVARHFALAHESPVEVELVELAGYADAE